ncbi:MAG: epoxyalkane--coenzyme M transferase, partial [Alphaproteobacteria bacterium]|nr:epoxyalkane--coenzyme M transferase [Alphaproteobacteria bacterium]
MKYSRDRILTTHVGSLPRPQSLLDILLKQFEGDDYDDAALESLLTEVVRDIVAKQVAAGIDVVSDGEMSKSSYAFYVKHRLGGVGQRGDVAGDIPKAAPNRDLLD